MNEKNPYPQDTPEWQLWENMKSSEQLASSYYTDSQRFLKMSEAARNKSNKYAEALNKLCPANEQKCPLQQRKDNL